MGKRVLIPRHPSNAFFAQFGNAVLYEERAQLVPLLRTALATPPAPLSPKELYLLSWEAGTERLLDAARAAYIESASAESPGGRRAAPAAEPRVPSPGRVEARLSDSLLTGRENSSG